MHRLPFCAVAQVFVADGKFTLVLFPALSLDGRQRAGNGGLELSQVLFIVKVSVVGALQFDPFAARVNFPVIGVSPFKQDIEQGFQPFFPVFARQAHAVAF